MYIKTTNDYQISVLKNIENQRIILFLLNFKIPGKLQNIFLMYLESRLWKWSRHKLSGGFIDLTYGHELCHISCLWMVLKVVKGCLRVLRQSPQRSFFSFLHGGAQGMISFCNVRVMRILSPVHWAAVHQSC